MDPSGELSSGKGGEKAGKGVSKEGCSPSSALIQILREFGLVNHMKESFLFETETTFTLIRHAP